jgi:ClpP class serine protease
MSKKLIFALTKSTWLLEPGFANDSLTIVSNILEGKYKADHSIEDLPQISEVCKLENNFTGAAAYIVYPHSTFESVQAGSKAIVNITGPIFKYDNWCDYGSLSYAALIERIDASGKFTEIIYNFDTPGGEAAGTQTLAESIRNCKLKTIGIVQDGIAASAGYWMIAACDEIYVTTESSKVGSIGVYNQLYDYSNMEAAGRFPKVISVYSDHSEEKNSEYHQALEGNEKPMKENLLNPIAKDFIDAVKTYRGDKLNLSAGDPFKGKMFRAKEAIAIGLIDGIKSFDEILHSTGSRSGTQANSQIQNSNMKISIKKSWASLVAFMGMSFGDDQDAQETELTAEQLESINTELSTIAEKTTQIESLTGLVSEREASIETLNNSIAERDATIATHTASIAERDATIATLTARVAELGAKPGAEATQTIAAKPDKVETAAAENEILSEADIELKKNREKNAALGIN